MLTNVPNFIQPATIVGFTAAIGAKSNNHIVDGVIIRPLCDEDHAHDHDDATGSMSGTLSAREWAEFGPFELDEGVLIATMTGTEYTDLYVRDGARPTISESDCRPYSSTSDETCRMERAGTYFVSTRGLSLLSS